MAKRTRDWAWRRLSEGEGKQYRPPNYRKPDFMTNKRGETVRQHVVHPTTPALDRFNAKTERVLVNDEACIVWKGGETFRVDDNTITTPARFYWESVLGQTLADGEVLIPACKTPRCLTHREKTYGPGASQAAVARKFLRGKQCVVCGWDRCLDAAHIIPASKGGAMADSNLLPLCPNHHRLFDTSALTEDEQQKVENYIQARSDVK